MQNFSKEEPKSHEEEETKVISTSFSNYDNRRYKKTIKKILHGIKCLLPSLEGEELQSASYRIFYLEAELKRSEDEEKLMFNLEKKPLSELTEQIYKETYIFKGLNKMLKLTENDDIKERIKLTQSKIAILKQVHNVNTSNFQEFYHNKNKSKKRSNRKFSGKIGFKIQKFFGNPSIENSIFLINIDSKNMLKARVEGGILRSFQVCLDSRVSNIEVNLIESGFILKFVDNMELELFILKKRTLLGYYYTHPMLLKELTKDSKDGKKIISFSINQICIITFEIYSIRDNTINRKSAEIVTIKRFLHVLNNYTQYSPFRCCVCNKLINGVGYSCVSCTIKCHKSCSNYLLFNCLNPPTESKKLSKHLFISRYDIKHNFINIKSTDLHELSMNWCYLCGLHIIDSKSLIECTKCKQYFHETCKSYIPNSCGIDLLLRKKMCNFKPKSLIQKEKSNTSIEDYKLLKTIGKGGFGKTILVEEKASREQFVFKVISKQKTLETNTTEYLISEREILELVSSAEDTRARFIGTMHSSFEDNYNFYFVLTFYPGGDLLRFHKKNKLSNFQRKLYCAQIFLGLTFLHSKNIVYRDLKMENILLDSHGNLRIIDFGLSKVLKGTTNTFCGTIDTIAPEVINQEEYGCEIDWWSYGCIVYELFEYKPPFQGDTPSEIQEIILSRGPTFSKSTEVIKDLILKLLERDKDKRLGCNGSEDIKKHWFFNDLDWNKVLKKDYIVDLTPHDQIIDNFDIDCNSKTVKISFIEVEEEI